MDLNAQSQKKYDLLSDQEKKDFMVLYESRKRPWAFYLLLFFLGQFAAHKFYVGNTGLGWLYICLIFLPLVFRPLIQITYIIWFILIMIDIFTGVMQVRRFNERYFERIIDNMYNTHVASQQTKIESQLEPVSVSGEDLPNIGL